MRKYFGIPGLSLLLLFLSLTGAAAADPVRVDYAFEAPAADAGPSGTLSIPGCTPFVEPGFPVVPFRLARILLPEGVEAGEITVTTPGYARLPGSFRLPVAQDVLPLAAAGPAPGARRRTFDGVFPASPWRMVGVQRLRGRQVLLLQLFPVRYDAGAGRVDFLASISVSVAVAPAGRAALDGARSALEPAFGSAADARLVRAFVDNPAAAPEPAWRAAPLAGGYSYVIIAPQALAAFFQPLLNDRLGQGLTGRLVTVEEITEDWTSEFYQPIPARARDRAEQVRNFIIYAWYNWQTRYVLLGGDTEHIPAREFYNPEPSAYGGPIPADMYYSNLDGDFDFNANGVFGEPGDGPDGGEVDLLADVSVGRAPVSTVADVNNFVAKTIAYRLDGTAALGKVALVGQQLDGGTVDTPPNWGCDGKDAIAPLFPAGWEIQRYYERDRTFSGAAIKQAIEGGLQVVNNFSHGNEGDCFGFESGSDIRNLLNTRYPLFYSQGCYEGAFDLQDQSVGETFVTAQRAAVAFVGNSRFGWYSPWDVRLGPSQLFDREFFDVLFTRNVAGLGAAFHRHKDNLAGLVPLDWGFRYVMYELNLFGDPALEVLQAPFAPDPAEIEGRLYYIRDNEIYARDLAAGTAVQLTTLAQQLGPGELLPFTLDADGRRIVFAYRAGGVATLYRVNADGSGLVNLTETLQLSQLTTDPHTGALSPRGGRLAFAAANSYTVSDGRQLWVRELSGASRLVQLTFFDGNVSHPVFLDENRILFRFEDRGTTRQDYYQVFVSGTGLVNLTGNNESAPYFPRLGRPYYGRDLDRLIYARQAETTETHLDWALYTRDLFPGAGEQPVLEPLYFSQLPAFQPDPAPVFVGDDLLVFAGEHPQTLVRQFYLARYNGENPYQQLIPDTVNASYPVFHRAPKFAVRLVFTGAEAFQPQLYFRQPDGTTPRITDHPAIARDPVFDPAGRRLAYAAGGIRVRNTDGGDEIVIDAGNGFEDRHPAFSPCGRWVVFVRASDIYAAPADGTGAPRRLTSSPTVTKGDLAFAPDGARLLYTFGPGRQVGYLPVLATAADFVAGTSVRLTTLGANYQGAYQADGALIYFISNRNGPAEVFRMNPDGTGQAKVDLAPAPVNPSYPRPSPVAGDRRLLFLSEGTLRLADLERGAAAEVMPRVLVSVLTDAGRADWSVTTPVRLNVVRSFVFNRAAPDVPFYYDLDIAVDYGAPADAFILTEIIPAGWVLDPGYSTLDGQPIATYNQATTGALKWYLSADTPGFEDQRGLLRLRVHPSGDGPAGEYRLFSGYLAGADFDDTVRGQYQVEIGSPDLPVDFDGDGQISDAELLAAISYWAAGLRFNGWPLNLADWDYWLLRVIDFWVNPGGYQYDAAGGDAPAWILN